MNKDSKVKWDKCLATIMYAWYDAFTSTCLQTLEIDSDSFFDESTVANTMRPLEDALHNHCLYDIQQCISEHDIKIDETEREKLIEDTIVFDYQLFTQGIYWNIPSSSIYYSPDEQVIDAELACKMVIRIIFQGMVAALQETMRLNIQLDDYCVFRILTNSLACLFNDGSIYLSEKERTEGISWKEMFLKATGDEKLTDFVLNQLISNHKFTVNHDDEAQEGGKN